MSPEVRSKECKIRFTAEELMAVDAVAAAEGSPRAVWCHDAVIRMLPENRHTSHDMLRQILAELASLRDLITANSDALSRCAGLWNPYWDLDLAKAEVELKRRSELEARGASALNFSELNELAALRRSAIAGGLWEVWNQSGMAAVVAAKAGR